ncbi:MAG: hypothetical protein IJT97_12060 [Bacteroidaceae bacterium]|nr:hypothetical protein [Bacteroidaceae bacterium]
MFSPTRRLMLMALMAIGVFCYSQTVCLWPYGHLLARPRTPAHLNTHTATLEAVTSRVIRVRQTGRAPWHPAPQSCTRCAPLHMSRMKSLIGCKVVVRIEESMTVVTQA